MDRSDVLTKSHSSNETLSITDAVVRHSNNNANSLDTKSVFKLISSANDLDHQRRFDLDKMDECTKQTIINKFLSGASALTAAAAAAATSNNDNNVDTMMNDTDTGINVQQLFDAQNTTTKNKRKNFKPRNATAAIDIEPSANDQILLNLMMQNKLKQLHDMNNATSSTTRALDTLNDNNDGDGDDDSNGGSDSDANHYKSPPSSPPMVNGHDDPFKINLLHSLQQQKHSNQSLAAIYSQFLPVLPITSQSTDYGTTTNDSMDSTYATKRTENGKLFVFFSFLCYLLFEKDLVFFFLLRFVGKLIVNNLLIDIIINKIWPLADFPMVYDPGKKNAQDAKIDSNFFLF